VTVRPSASSSLLERWDSRALLETLKAAHGSLRSRCHRRGQRIERRDASGQTYDWLRVVRNERTWVS